MDPVLAACGLVPKREVGVLGSRPFGVFQKEAISTYIGQPGRTACTSSFNGPAIALSSLCTRLHGQKLRRSQHGGARQ